MKGLRSGRKPETLWAAKVLGYQISFLELRTNNNNKKKATGANFSGYTEDMQMAVNTFFFKTLVVTSFSSQLL